MEHKDQLCPVCCTNDMSNRLELYQVNYNSAVYMCKYPGCVYPEGFGWTYVDRNVFDNDASDDSDYDFDREIKEMSSSKGTANANIGYSFSGNKNDIKNIETCDTINDMKIENINMKELNIKYNISQSDDTQLNNIVINIENTSLLESNQVSEIDIDNSPVVLAESEKGKRLLEEEKRNKSPNKMFKVIRIDKLPTGKLTQIIPSFEIKIQHDQTGPTTKNTQTSKETKNDIKTVFKHAQTAQTTIQTKIGDYDQTAQTTTNHKINDQTLSGIKKGNIEAGESAQIKIQTKKGIQNSKGIENKNIESVLKHSETAQIITKTKIDTQKSNEIENENIESVLKHSETAQIITKTKIDTQNSKGSENENIESVPQCGTAQIITKTIDNQNSKEIENKNIESMLQHSETAQIITETKSEPLNGRKQKKIRAATKKERIPTQLGTRQSQRIKLNVMNTQQETVENIDAPPKRKTKKIKREVQCENEINFVDNTSLADEQTSQTMKNHKINDQSKNKNIKHIGAQPIKRTKNKNREVQFENNMQFKVPELKLDFFKVFSSRVNHKCKKEHKRYGHTESLFRKIEHDKSKIKGRRKHNFEGFQFRIDVIRPVTETAISEPLPVQNSLKTKKSAKIVDTETVKIPNASKDKYSETIQNDVQLEENVLDEFFSNIDNIQPIPVPEDAVSVTDIDDWLQKL